MLISEMRHCPPAPPPLLSHLEIVKNKGKFRLKSNSNKIMLFGVGGQLAIVGTLLKVLAKSNKNLFAIASKSKKEQ